MNVVALEPRQPQFYTSPSVVARDIAGPIERANDRYALIQVDRFGHLLSQNWTAQTLLQDDSFFRVVHSVLLPADPNDDDHWFQLLLEVSRTMSPRVLLINSGGHRLPVAVTPNADRSLEVRIQVGISVSERTLGVAFSSLRLTEAEREVLRSLLHGVKPKTIASQKFRSESTVRSHIKSLLAKCGCKSLQEVIVLFGRMPDLV